MVVKTKTETHTYIHIYLYIHTQFYLCVLINFIGLRTERNLHVKYKTCSFFFNNSARICRFSTIRIIYFLTRIQTLSRL